MFGTLIIKELKSVLLSPKFPVTFAVASVLLLLSVFVGIREYEAEASQYYAANDLVHQEMREARNWMSVNDRVYRQPDPMHIFVSGVHNDIGRFSSISSWQPVKLVNSAYGDDPIFALFRFIDFSFIAEVVLTLLAILFTYDAINGERESGTLQLMLSNAVPRAQVILAKFVGSWLGLVIPLSVPIALSIVLLFVFNVPMTGEHWIRLVFLLFASGMLFTFFVAFGILMSTLTRRSNMSFLLCLVGWIAAVLIIPRFGIMLAGQIVSIPTVAEVESKQDAYAKNAWDSQMKVMSERWRARSASLEGLKENERKAKREEMEWAWAEEDQNDRKKMQNEIDENAKRLGEDLRNRKLVQEKLAFSLSRFSPVSAYQFAAMNLAWTDIGLKTRYEDELSGFRTTFNQYKDQKQKESGATGGIRISVDSKEGVKIDAGREIALDLTGMPQFRHSSPPLSDSLAPAVVDFGIMGIFSILAFAGAFFRFLRYDVRYAN